MASDDGMFERNMAALQEAQPILAEAVMAMSCDDGVFQAVGRDGASTFQLLRNDGRRVWFGESSMPTVSAPEVLAGFSSSVGSVLLPGVLTGWEPLFVLQRLSVDGALFVLEDDSRNIGLAFRLYDFATPLREGRLLFARTDRLEDDIRSIVERHPGYLLPDRLLTVPQKSASRIADLQRKIEATGPTFHQAHVRAMERATDRIRSRTFESPPLAPRVAVLGVDTTPLSLEQARRVARALDALGWPHELCIPDSPRRCHVAARLQAIDRLGADLVLWINADASAATSFLPPELPTAAWRLPGCSVPARQDASNSRSFPTFVCSAEQERIMLESGAAPRDVIRCEVGADTRFSEENLDETKDRRVEAADDIVILADLPDDRPASLRITLPSQLDLWRAVQRLAPNFVDESPRQCDELLKEAERRSGAAMRDDRLREQFRGLLHSHILPAALARVAAAVCRSLGKTALFGHHWSVVEEFRALHRGSIPTGEGLSELLKSVTVLVLPSTSDFSVQTALDALAHGTTVIVREAPQPMDRTHPGLRELLPCLRRFRTRQELIAHVREALERRIEPTVRTRIRKCILERHSVAARLRFIVQCLRERATSPGRL